jgi:hypothetical protein
MPSLHHHLLGLPFRRLFPDPVISLPGLSVDAIVSPRISFGTFFALVEMTVSHLRMPVEIVQWQ